MRAVALALAALALAACGQSTQAPAAESKAPGASATRTSNQIDANGYGPVSVGMTIDEAGAALGTPLTADEAFDDPELCQTWHLGAAGETAVYYMAQHRRITRVSVGEGGDGGAGIRTPEGVGVGSTDAEVRAAYPNAVQLPAPYDEAPAHDLVVWARPRESGLRFELDQSGRVVRMHGGDESILLIEGCL